MRPLSSVVPLADLHLRRSKLQFARAISLAASASHLDARKPELQWDCYKAVSVGAYMLVHFVVISVFDRENHRYARLGPKDPDLAHQSVAATLNTAGISIGKPLDPMWYLMFGDKFVGYVKVFREERYARNWFRDLCEREFSRNFWALWRDGYPLALVNDANAKDANQFANYVSLCRVRAFSAQRAAENGWKNWISGNLTAMEVSLDDSRGRATKEQIGREAAAVDRTSRQSNDKPKAPPLSVKYSKWQITRGPSSIDGPRPNEELTRTYELSGLAPPDTTATFGVICKLESEGLEGGIDAEQAGLKLNCQIRFYLRPFRLPHDATFVMGLFTEDQSKGGEFDVLASPVDRDTSVFAKFGGRNDTRTCLDVMMAGKDINFTLADEKESLVKLRLPNDGEFKRLFDETSDRLARAEITYQLMRSQFGR
jgi:hypothetical protein